MLCRYVSVTRQRTECAYISIQTTNLMEYASPTTCFHQPITRILCRALAPLCVGVLAGCSSAPNDRLVVSAQAPSSIPEGSSYDEATSPPSELELSLTQYLSSLVGAWDVYLPDEQRSGGTAIFLKDVRDGQPIFRLLHLPENSRNESREAVFFVANERIWREARHNLSAEVGLISTSEPGCSVNAGKLFFQSYFYEWFMGYMTQLICMQVDDPHTFVELWRTSELCGTVPYGTKRDYWADWHLVVFTRVR